MAVPLDKMKERIKLSPEREERISQRAQMLIEEEMTLRELRKVQQLTQESMAKLLGIEQDSVSRMERRTDMLLSTMSSFVTAMGGSLRLIAEFPNRRPVAIRLSDLQESSRPPARPGRRKKGRIADRGGQG
jgi:DNA-binding XRE family transcriptional regulator